MELFQLTSEGVSVSRGKLRFAEAADGVQHVQRPAAFFDADFFQRFHPLEFFADFLRRNDDGSSRPVLSILRSRLLRRTGVAIRRRVDVSRL